MASFYIDHDVANRVASLLQASGHHAVLVRTLGTMSAPDSHHLLAATQGGRILISHNRGDYLLLHDAWHRWGQAWGVSPPHAGILILPHMPPESVTQRIGVFLQSGQSAADRLHEWSPRLAQWVPAP